MGRFSQLIEMFVTAVKIRLTARRNFCSSCVAGWVRNLFTALQLLENTLYRH
jgi:hypothetical protein